MIPLVVGALAIVALLLFFVVVALGGAMLALSAAEPPSPWDEPAPETEEVAVAVEREDA